jgi:hypothetical protein
VGKEIPAAVPLAENDRVLGHPHSSTLQTPDNDAMLCNFCAWRARVEFIRFATSLLLSALVLAGPGNAQDCDLTTLAHAKLTNAAPVTTFLPSGSTAQILVRWDQPNNTAWQPPTVRIFEVKRGEADYTKWEKVAEATVTAVRPTPANTYQGLGFSQTNSVIADLIVPEKGVLLVERRDFVVRVCGQGDDKSKGAWSLVVARVSSQPLARLLSMIILLALYAAFAYAVSSIRRPTHPLAAKWPAYAYPQTYGFFRSLDPVVLTAGATHQGNIQKLQVLLFTFVVGGMVLSLVLTVGWLPNFSPTVALLLGISAVGAAVAQKATTNNDRLHFDNWAWLVRRHVIPIHSYATPKWSDLVTTNREFDVYKLQTLLFSGVVAVALLITGEERLDIFAVPETLLGILGLSQVVYVAGALVRPPSIAELDKAVSDLRDLEAKLHLAVTYNVDTDYEGKLPPLRRHEQSETKAGTAAVAPALTTTPAPTMTPVPTTTAAPAPIATAVPVATTTLPPTTTAGPSAPLPSMTEPPGSGQPHSATLKERAAGKNVLALYEKKADQVETMLESTFEIEVARPNLDPR